MSKIDKLKKRAAALGEVFGYSHPLTVKASQKLDKLIVKEMKSSCRPTSTTALREYEIIHF